MSWRRIGIIYALCAVLGAYLYTVQSTTSPEGPLQDEGLPPVAEVLSTRVTRITIAWPGVELDAVRDGERWRVERPAGGTATSDLIDTLIDTLTSIPPIQRVDEDDANLAEYGLAPPYAVVTLVGDEPEPLRVSLGRQNPTRTAVYVAKPGGQDVYLLGLAARYYVELLRDEIRAAGPQA